MGSASPVLKWFLKSENIFEIGAPLVFIPSEFLNVRFLWIFRKFSWFFHLISRFSYPSGTRGFEFRVRVYRVWTEWQKFGFGFNGFTKNGSKPVGFSGSGKPDPPLVHTYIVHTFVDFFMYVCIYLICMQKWWNNIM